MSNLVNCKACGKEVAKGVKKCVHCGKDQRNFFMRHKILTAVVIIFALGVLGSGGGDEGNDTPPVSTAEISQESTSEEIAETEEVEEVAVEEAVKYGNGTYLVGQDIESGLYKVTVTDRIMKMGYVERAKDLNMELDSILANIILTGDGYVEIKDTDVAVKLQGVEIMPIDINDIEPNIKTEVGDGIHLVGFDIEPGTYKVEVTDTTMGMGYVERARNVSMGFDDIIANEIIQGQGYVNIQESDFAIRVQGAKLVRQE